MAGRIQLAGMIPGPSLRQTVLGLIADGGQGGTLTLHASGDPVPIYPSETAPTADPSGSFVTDLYGMPPGWIDRIYLGKQVDYWVPPQPKVTVMVGVTFTVDTPFNGGDNVTVAASSTAASTARDDRFGLSYTNLDAAALVYVSIDGPAVLEQGDVIYPRERWSTPENTGGIVFPGIVYLISTIDGVLVARMEI